MAKKVNKEEPTLDKQLEKYSKDNQNEDDPIFSHAYKDFLVKLLKTRDKAIISEVIEFVADNETFAEKVANKVRGDIADSYIALERVLTEIKDGQVAINTKLLQIETKVLEHDTNLVNLQTDINILKSRNTIVSYTIRGIIYIAIAVILFMLFFPWAHKHLAMFKSDNQVKNEWVDKLKVDQARGYSTIERGNYATYPKTDAQIDSLENEQIKSLIK